MSETTILILSMSWLFWLVFITPGSLLIVLYYKFSSGLSTSKAFVKGYAGWFYTFIILCVVTAGYVVKYHPALN